jgi:hypothetical protein
MQRRAILLSIIASALPCAPANAARKVDCPAIYHLDDLPIVRRGSLSLPERDRIPFPVARATVTCVIGRKGRLTGCASDLGDARGPALASYVSHWNVPTVRAGKCPVWGRKYVVAFHLLSG